MKFGELNEFFELPHTSISEFKVEKMQGLEALWSATHSGISEQCLVDKYSFGVASNSCFKNVSFIDESEFLVVGEKYGGLGSSGNGGGVRCGNIGDIQVKGIGTNPLVGNDIPEWYSNGALNIIDAASEVIYSNVLEKAMPIGSVKCLGIILTGQDTAFHTECFEQSNIKTCTGTLLVRQGCLRPAHFMRARDYEIHTKYRSNLISDVARTRAVNKVLCEAFEDESKFTVFLSEFLSKNANQFAFAKAARIAHGATSPSNIAMDGKWLDLTTCSFLDSTKNYCIGEGQRSFLNEQLLIKETLFELCSTYEKFNKTKINVGLLLLYFDEAYNYYFHQHCSFILGVPKDLWPEKETSPECDAVVKALEKVIHLNNKVVLGSPNISVQQDAMSRLIDLLFSSLFNRKPNENISDLLSSEDVENVCTNFRKVIDGILSGSAPREKARIITHFYLTASKKSKCSEYFYRGRIRGLLEKYLYEQTPYSYRQLIDDSSLASEWIFTDHDDQVLLFKSENFLIKYCSTNAEYVLEDFNALSEISFNSYSELAKNIACMSKTDFMLGSHSFQKYLMENSNIVSVIENREIKIDE